MTLIIKNLVIYNREKKALFEPINFEVKPGEILSLMGPSGCGKSTLLNAIAGHLTNEFDSQGTITLNNRTLDTLQPHQREIGILFQDDLLFPHLSVVENLAFALPNTVKGKKRLDVAYDALCKINLAELTHSKPEHVSGGQRARISLLRMLLAKPQAILLDEPFSKLDKELREQFRVWVFAQIAEANVPAVLVTHDHSDIPHSSRCLTWPWRDEDAR